MGGIPWGGIPWGDRWDLGTDGTLGPMGPGPQGPWASWTLGLKDPRSMIPSERLSGRRASPVPDIRLPGRMPVPDAGPDAGAGCRLPGRPLYETIFWKKSLKHPKNILKIPGKHPEKFLKSPGKVREKFGESPGKVRGKSGESPGKHPGSTPEAPWEHPLPPWEDPLRPWEDPLRPCGT